MADNHIEIGVPELTAEDAAKQRLLGRIAVAAVVIVGLLGSLAMFDALYAPRAKAPPTLATVTPPVMPEVKPAEPPVAEPSPPANAAPLPATPAPTPEITTAAPAEPLPPLPSERLTKPVTAQKALAHPPGAMSPPPTAAELQREMQRETARADAAKSASTKAAPMPTSPSKPLSQPPQPAQELVAGKSTKPAAGPLTALLPSEQSTKQFALQLGVFSNFANAEELRSKLEAAGIPTTVEARVRAGPFATRGEADAARAKLRALGIEESIMVSVKH